MPKATKEEQIKTKGGRREEIINIRAEINEVETKKTIEKIHEMQNQFFENISKIIDKTLARHNKKKRERAQINKIRKKREVTTDTTGIQRPKRNDYRRLYANKMDNQEEMDKFLERHNLPRLKEKQKI